MNKHTLRLIVFAGLFAVPFIPFLTFSSLFFPFITSKAFAFRIVIEVIFACWAVLALSDKAYRPKRSWLLYAVLAFIAIVGLADVLGANAFKSFWSNFERMEGFLAILHLGAYFLVASSMFNEEHWKKWWNTTLVASAFMVCYTLFQVLGAIKPSQSDARVDGTFGNAIYLAVYLLFHIFIALMQMTREWKNKNLRMVYGALILSQVFILYFTATRGTILGLLGGLLVLAFLNLWNYEDARMKKLSIGVLTALLVLVGGFFFVKDTNFVKESPVLSRFATLNLSDLKSQGRYFIWPMAWEGIKERPILGWGQENFSYVFQKHYRPEMYNLEPWFDRAHNVFLDWAVAGGLLALALYLSLYALALYFIWKKDDFSYVEKSVLTSLIAAYFFHNLFVFDHLFSYVFFFSVLAYLQARSAGEPLWKKDFSSEAENYLAVPVIGVLALVSLYFINWKPLVANTSLIQALQSANVGKSAQAVEAFERSYRSSPLGRQEGTEQLVVNAPRILSSDLSMEAKNLFFRFAKEAVLKQGEKFPDDARYQLVAGTFFGATSSLDEGLLYLERARSLSPNKQQIYLEIAQAYYAKGDKNKAIEALRYIAEITPELAPQMEEYILQIQAQ